MTFDQPTRRPRRENVVPMINVVFLLLIFFMISSELTPPPPVQVTPPQVAVSSEPDIDDTLYATADGTLAWRELRDDAALSAMAAETRAVAIRADADLPAGELARLLTRLRRLGVTQIELATRQGGQ